MQIQWDNKEKEKENLIPLINIVFLILIFFLIATVIRPFSAKDLTLAKAVEDETFQKLPNTLVISKDGQLMVQGKPIVIETLSEVFGLTDYEGPAKTLNIIADQALPADQLLKIISKVDQKKLGNIKLVIEKTAR